MSLPLSSIVEWGAKRCDSGPLRAALKEGDSVADFIELSGTSGRVAVDLTCGHLADLALPCGDGLVRPLHRAPWADSADTLDPAIPPVVRHLSGDFLCAPFAESDVDGGPAHGPTANAPWMETARPDGQPGDARVTLTCTGMISGARVQKTLRFRGDDPVLYQEHCLVGGHGALPVSHHAMIRPQTTCRLSMSAKRYLATSPDAIEPDATRGRSILAYPQRVAGLDRLDLKDGRTVDARTYPFADRHEDLAILMERDLDGIGWTAAAHASEGFLVFFVKLARVLPATVLWFSNGGRDYPPFDESPGRVLGIEDACTFIHAGHRASAAPNWMSNEGVPTALSLEPNGVRTIRHAIGVVPIDATWSGDVTLTPGDGRLVIRDLAGPEVMLPFDDAWIIGETV